MIDGRDHEQQPKPPPRPYFVLLPQQDPLPRLKPHVVLTEADLRMLEEE